LLSGVEPGWVELRQVKLFVLGGAGDYDDDGSGGARTVKEERERERDWERLMRT
jgi:hypothetical protein